MPVKVLSQEEFSVFTSNLHKLSYRDRAICSLLIFCGLRNAEVCSLLWSDIVTMGHIKTSIYIRAINSKSGVARFIPVPAPCVDALKIYMDETFPLEDPPEPDKSVFITKNMKIRIQPMDVQRIVAASTLQLFGKAYNPHALRHTFADQLLKYTNIRVVQTLLGHKSLSSTQIYTHPTTADCTAASSRAFNP